MTGSVQLNRYLAARRTGLSREDAAFEAGISVEEARLTDIAEERGELSAPAQPQEGATTMAKTAKAKTEDVETIHKPDFDLAVSIYRNDIRPAQAKVGEYAQEQSSAYKAIKNSAHVHPGAAKLAFKLAQMEDHKRDDYLRSLYGLMRALNLGISSDLIDMMGDNDAPTMPVAERKPVELVSIQ